MNRWISTLLLACALGIATVAFGQGRILDMVADKVIQKYASATCGKVAGAIANRCSRAE